MFQVIFQNLHLAERRDFSAGLVERIVSVLRRRQRREPCKAIFKGDLAKRDQHAPWMVSLVHLVGLKRFGVFLRSILLVDLLNHMDTSYGIHSGNMKINHDILDRLS